MVEWNRGAFHVASSLGCYRKSRKPWCRSLCAGLGTFGQVIIIISGGLGFTRQLLQVPCKITLILGTLGVENWETEWSGAIDTFTKL